MWLMGEVKRKVEELKPGIGQDNSNIRYHLPRGLRLRSALLSRARVFVTCAPVGELLPDLIHIIYEYVRTPVRTLAASPHLLKQAL